MSIIDGKFDLFVKEFLHNYFPDGNVPKWCIDALEVAGITLLCVYKQ